MKQKPNSVLQISIVLAIAATFLSAVSALATVQPAGIFTDGTVLQRGEPVRIWGVAAAGEKVTVAFAGQSKAAVADPAGKWMVALDEMPVCAQGRPLVIQGSATAAAVELKDVLVGEVWLASGQSNMETPMVYSDYLKTTQRDIEGANDPLLRLVTIPRLEFAGANTDRPHWQSAQPPYVPGFSACAYYFAKNLRERLKVPVGIISCSFGGTPAEAWMSRPTFESQPSLKRILDAYEAGYRETFPDEAEYLKQFNQYVIARDAYAHNAATNGGNPTVPAPPQPMGPRNYMRPAGLHETMLTQTIPFTLRGVIWYQGENNASTQNGFDYRTVFPALIQEWRGEFKNRNLPFLFVQLATYDSAAGKEPFWPELRESQSWTEEHVKNTGMIVLTDGGEEHNIHPNSKDKAGYRLSLLARNLVYGEKELLCHGPRLQAMKREKSFVKLTFKDIGAGLVLKPETNSAFEICGADGIYYSAEARLADGKIFISAAGVTDPQNVRYGWRKWFVPTLFNQAGLPAAPFRTDDFTPVTKGRYYLDGR